MDFSLLILIILLALLPSLFLAKPTLEQYSSPSNNSTELIIAYCKEDISWISNYIDKFDLITVYKKCNQPVDIISDKVRVIDLPNIGSCDYAYLTYIIDRYDTLPNTLVFTKGSRPPDTSVRTFDCSRNNDIDTYKKFKKISVKHYSFSNPVHKEMSKASAYVPSQYANIGEWIENSNFLSEDLFKNKVHTIIYGGVFSVSKDQILKHPKELYEDLRNQQTHQQEEVDHFIERSWGPLFCSD
jgi:hypothetical protein